MTTTTNNNQTTQVREITTIIFDNHLPLRTRQEITEVWLDYAYLDFGGEYFKYCPCIKERGAWHCWLRHVTPYCDGRSYNEYIGLVRDYDSLVAALKNADVSYKHQGIIIREMGDVIEMPEC